MLGMLLTLVIFGGLAGWIASLITGRDRDMGCLANIVVGVIGAIVGRMVFAGLVGVPFERGFERGLAFELSTCSGFIVSVIGAILFLAAVNLVSGRR
jgi:uncharacterized membrane protein YeaQ/YmgE (transglycosylase-associated protein family)